MLMNPHFILKVGGLCYFFFFKLCRFINSQLTKSTETVESYFLHIHKKTLVDALLSLSSDDGKY